MLSWLLDPLKSQNKKNLLSAGTQAILSPNKGKLPLLPSTFDLQLEGSLRKPQEEIVRKRKFKSGWGDGTIGKVLARQT